MPLLHASGWMTALRVGVGAVRLLPGLLRVALLTAVSFGLHALVPVVSPLAVGVVLGVVTSAAGFWTARSAPGATFAAKRLLRLGIVLIGLQLSVAQIAELGLAGLVAVVVTVTVTFFGIQLLARLFGLGSQLGLLVGAGYGICGLSAVAAVQPQTRADEKDVTAAVALVTLCGTLSIAVLPAVGRLIGLAEHTFGAWAGAAVHDVGQAVATSAVVGGAALNAAIVVKLTRVLMLAPLVVGLGIVRRRQATVDAAGPVSRPPLVPLFVAGFVGAILLRSTGLLPEAVIDLAGTVQRILLTAALVGLGSAVRWQQLRGIGGRVLGFGLTAWVLVAGTALAAVTLAGL